MTETPTISVDVAVVGAGPCGLISAYRLGQAGHSVAVLEARDRVGGRTWSENIDGAELEIGGQWVSPDQTALLSLLEELGLHTYSRYREGASVFLNESGERIEYNGDDFPLDPQINAEIDRLVAAMDELSAQIDPESPWSHPHARELDSISFKHWLASISDNFTACETVGLFIAGGMLTKPDHAFSALQAGLMAASAGGFSHLLDEDFILDKRVITGMQSVSTTLAESLSEALYLNSAVRSISWSHDGATVVSDRVNVQASQVVLAVPPPLYSRISFSPPLPRFQHQMHQHQSMGLVIKVHAVYETPFWRERGLSGTGFGIGTYVQEVYDNSNFEDPRGTVVAFVSDEKADALFAVSAQERQELILADLAAFLGEQARSPQVYYESDWAAEEWTRGAYASSYDLGGLHRYGARQREMVGPIAFASSDLAGLGYQHVDGAIRVGQDTAKELMIKLGEQ